MSGLAAAVEAVEQGASVLVLEKVSMVSGNGLVTEGFFAMNSSIQQEAGVDFTLSDVMTREQAITNYKGSAMFWHDIALASAENIDWLMDHGVTFAELNNYGGSAIVDCFHVVDGGSAAVIAALQASAEAQGVEILTDSLADELIINNGQVVGAWAKTPDGDMRIDCKAVILATGGFQSNPDMLAERGYAPENCFCIGFDNHDGDGLTMAISTGGFDNSVARSHCSMMSHMKWSVDTPSYRKVFGIGDVGDYMWVNQDGYRFCNENCGKHN